MSNRKAVAEFTGTSRQADSNMISQSAVGVQSSVAGPCVPLHCVRKGSGVTALGVWRGYVYFRSGHGL